MSQRGRILIVDDAAASRDMLAAIYRAAGFQDLALAADGPSALDAAAAQVPDLVVLDLVMPGMDGFEVCRRLRQRPDFEDVPILVQSALTDPADRTAAFMAGATDVVSKPTDPREILARTRVHLDHRFILRELQEYRAGMEREFAMARPVYRGLMPDTGAVAAFLDPGAAGHAAAALGDGFGGDVWGLSDLGDGSRVLHLVDVGSSGAVAAVNAFNMRAALDRLLEPGLDPAELVSLVAETVAEPGESLPWSGLCCLRRAADGVAWAASGGARLFRLAEGGRLRPLPAGPLGPGYGTAILASANTLEAAGGLDTVELLLAADPEGAAHGIVERARAAGRNGAVALVLREAA